MKYFTLSILLFFLFNFKTISQPAGSIDPSFGFPQITQGDSSRFNAAVKSILIQPDQKIIAGGAFTSYNGETYNYIVRLNNDGTIDTSFHVGTGFDGQLTYLGMQSTGKIIGTGDFTTYDGQSCKGITRLNPNGSIDNSFSVGNGFNNSVYAFCIQPDDKVIVCGNFTDYNGTALNNIARLNPDGQIDTSFHMGSGFDDFTYSVSFDSINNKIYIGGNFINYNGSYFSKLIRLNIDGTVDNSFNISIGFDYTVAKILIQPDSKIIAGGYFINFGGISKERIIRLSYSGAADASFNVQGFNNPVKDMALDHNGNILVCGEFTFYGTVRQNYFTRLTPNGNIDPTFQNGTSALSAVYSIKIQSDDKIVAGGNFQRYNGSKRSFILRIYDNGIVDNSFKVEIGFNSDVRVITVQPDGKILIGGNFNYFNSSYYKGLIRLDLTGDADTSFHSYSTGSVYAIALDTIRDKMYIGGYFSLYQGYSRNRFARINMDGSLDTTYSIGSGFDGDIYNIIVQPNGFTIIAGAFTSYNGTLVKYLTRLDNQGVIDPTFNTGGSGFGASVETMSLLPNGKIVVGGDFQSIDGISKNHIVRLNANGTIDSTFNIGTGFSGKVTTLSLQPDGKAIAGGAFASYNSLSANNIIRLNTDGSVDSTFNFGNGFNQQVNAITLQHNGKMVIGGNFTTYNTTSTNFLIRINSDGSTDNSFSIGNGFNSNIFALAIQNDGNILAGGSFNQFENYHIHNLVRLYGDLITSVGTISSDEVFSISPNPASSSATIILTNPYSEPILILLINLQGQIIQKQISYGKFAEINFRQPAGVYLVGIKTTHSFISKKIVILNE